MVSLGIFAGAHYANSRQYQNRYSDISDPKLTRAVEVFIREEVDFESLTKEEALAALSAELRRAELCPFVDRQIEERHGDLTI